MFTTLADGTIENRKALRSKVGKGLVGFAFPQSVDDEVAGRTQEAWKSRKSFMTTELNQATTQKDKDEANHIYI